VSETDQAPINAATRCCAVFGQPIQHSASPAMQNAGIAALGLNWRYLAFEVHPDDLKSAITGARTMKYVGLNLTVPHKLLALGMVDVLDETARNWGAVNTIRFEGRVANGDWVSLGQCDFEQTAEIRSHGFNTDADAILRALREELDLELSDSRVLLIGTGGAGRVAALRLAAEGVKDLFLVNRTGSKANELAAEIRDRFPRVRAAVGYPNAEIDLLLNATSLGLKESDLSPVDEKLFSLGNTRTVYDMIYRPAETRLLKLARAAGCRTANGLGMLLYQGAKALEIWSGKPAPVSVMRRALEKNVYGT
jgi:shikimate dehydrogenase